MDIKYKKPLIVASIINFTLGGFLIICGILEFTGILKTPANNSISTLGVQLSYVVFISGILIFISGIVTFLDRHRLNYINLDIFLGLIALAFPIFISVVLLLQAVLCIRFIPTILASLFYMVAVLIVKLSNEEMRKIHKINTQMLAVGERRQQKVNVTQIFKGNNMSRARSANISSIGRLAGGSKRRLLSRFDLRMLLNGKRKSNSGLFKGLYSGSRHRRKF